MKKMLASGAIAAVLALSGPAFAADMPVKAAPLVAPIYNWSGFYLGFHDGYNRASVHDTTAAGFVTDSTVRNWMAGFHTGLQYQFAQTSWGSWVIGVEGSLNHPLKENNIGNFGACANPAFSCGLRELKDIWTVGGRLGLAFNWGGGWLFGGDYLLTVSGGWATANFVRADVLLATGAINAGGGQSIGRHDGSYVGAGLEHVLARGNLVDWIAGIDYQHIWFNAKGDLDANGVIHTMSADADIIRFRTTLKFK